MNKDYPSAVKKRSVSMIDSRKLKISIVGMSPAIVRHLRLKGIPLAPLALKAYVENRFKRESLDSIDIGVKTFFLEESTVDEISLQIVKDKPDILAFSVYIWNYQEVMECVRIIKNELKQTVIICGGPQVSPIAMEVMEKYPHIDVIPYITVPGELFFYHFIKAFVEEKELGTVKGIIYRDPGGLLLKTAPFIEKMDYSIVPSSYLDVPLSLTSNESYMAVLETSRGCPYDCGYCFNGRGMRKIEYFPLEKILKEIEMLYNKPGVKHVVYADSDILLSPRRAEIIIKHILKQKSSIVSEFSINILRLKESIAKLLLRLPHYRFCFALQTANPKALSCIGKLRPSVDIFAQKIKTFKQWAPEAKYSIDVMLGLPGDDFLGFKKTLDFCMMLEPERIAINYPVYLLPGTRFFEEKDKLGFNYSKTPPFCMIATKDFPKQDIETALRLVLWMDVLTYFYPAIARFFYMVCADSREGERIARLQRWIAAIEKRLDIFDSYVSLVDIAVSSSVKEWGQLKGRILRKASAADGAYKIYHAICQLEKAAYDDSADRSILLGREVFDYLRSREMSSVEFKDFDKLPQSITKDYHISEIKSIFSKYQQ